MVTHKTVKLHFVEPAGLLCFNFEAQHCQHGMGHSLRVLCLVITTSRGSMTVSNDVCIIQQSFQQVKVLKTEKAGTAVLEE